MASSPSREDLENIAGLYRRAYIAHDPGLAPFADRVKFSENNVEMAFPDGTWDTVARIVGEPLVLSDPQTGNVGLFLTTFHLDTPAFLAVRLGVRDGRIAEVEHILSTKRNVSTPPEPFGDAESFVRDPAMTAAVPAAEREPRAEMVRLANAYFDTLENNTGELRGVRFSPDCLRHENGLKLGDVEKTFRQGLFRANDRVRDRDYFIVDEERGVVMARGFIDHKGWLDDYTLTDGTPSKSIFREPHTWSLLEAFKIRSGMITAVEAVFYGAAYYVRSPFTDQPDSPAPRAH